MSSIEISKNVFCGVMCMAYEINRIHPDWSMDKCIEQAVMGDTKLIDLLVEVDFILSEIDGARKQP